MTSNPFVRNSDQQLLAFYWADKDLGREPSPLVIEELDRRNLAGHRPAMVAR